MGENYLLTKDTDKEPTHRALGFLVTDTETSHSSFLLQNMWYRDRRTQSQTDTAQKYWKAAEDSWGNRKKPNLLYKNFPDDQRLRQPSDALVGGTGSATGGPALERKNLSSSRLSDFISHLIE